MNKILNPIEYYSEKTLLKANLIIFVIGTGCAILLRGWFDHTFHLAFRTNVAPFSTFLENVFSILLIAGAFFATGKIINKKTRWIDSLNLAMYIRIPFYIMVLSNITGTFSSLTPAIEGDNRISVQLPTNKIDYVILIVFSLISLLVVILQFVIIYKGFRTLANAKKITDYLILAAFFIITMIISSIFFKYF